MATQAVFEQGIVNIGGDGGPSVWDGYATAAGCEAGVEAQSNGDKVAVTLNPLTAHSSKTITTAVPVV